MTVSLRRKRRGPWTRGALSAVLALGAAGLIGTCLGGASAQTIPVQIGIANAAPVIQSLNPSVIVANQNSTTIISGTGFSGFGFTTVSVTFNGSSATAFSVDSSTQITAQATLAPGVYTVRLVTSSGSSSIASGNADQLTAAAPTPGPPAPAPTATPARPPATQQPAAAFPVTAVAPPIVEATPAPAPDATPAPNPAVLATLSPNNTGSPSGTRGGSVVRPPQAPPASIDSLVAATADPIRAIGAAFFGLKGAVGAFANVYAQHMVMSVFASGLFMALMVGGAAILLTRRKKPGQKRPKIII